jgi:signal transduction histidine kinase
MSVISSAINTEKTTLPLIRVMFADDSAAIRTLARYALSAPRGFSIVAEAADGADAVNLVETHQPDCAVLDVEMPGVGGFEALRLLKRRYPALPVVMLSGFADRFVTDRAIADGAAAFLEKGDGLADLAETVRRVTQEAAECILGPPRPAEVEGAPNSTGRRVSADDGAAPAVADLRRLEYVVSHDLTEPVRIMSGFATLLQGRSAEQLDSSGKLFLEHIVCGAQRLQAMIDDLLVFSRAGQSRAEAEIVDVQQCVDLLRTKLAGRILDRRADITCAVLPKIVGDAAMLTTVLEHVLTNALLFNRSAVPQVGITGYVNGDAAVLTVQDNGIGMNPTDCQEVFQLFRRLNTRAEFPGTGSGLALCQRLVHIQAGSISISSRVAGGSAVTISLPAAPVPGEAHE